jgi:HK97 family phage major capsid protein
MLIDLQSEMKADYRREAVQLMNRRNPGKIRKFKDNQGLYIWERTLAAIQTCCSAILSCSLKTF